MTNGPSLDQPAAGSGSIEHAPRGTPATEETPEWAERLVRLLDDGFRVPFTDLKFGLDGVLGLFLPVAGDAITGVSAIAILGLALRQGVPTVILARMVGNIGVDLVVGSVPLVGDLFDFAWKANRRNLELLERFRDPNAEAGAGDYLVLALGVLLAVAIVVVPILLLLWLGGTMVDWIGG